MAFNLFDAEDRILDRATGLVRELDDARPDLRDGVAELVEAFRRGTREQRRLLRVSDRLQAQLAQVNQELGQRKQEVEAALERLRETQETLVRSEKLASLGALVAGIAHEINTPVGIALSAASFLSDAGADLRRAFAERTLTRGEMEAYLGKAGEACALVEANCLRAAELIASFKQVAVDRTTAEARRFDLVRYVHDVLVSLGPRLRRFPHAIAVEGPDALWIESHPGAISQVVTNLLLNALTHGFDPGQTGRLAITLAQDFAGGRVEITVSDNGKGIAPANLDRIFDPFFTTNRAHGGTGLGLHIVHNLVTGTLHGTIAVESQPGAGTTFTVSFPAQGGATGEQP